MSDICLRGLPDIYITDQLSVDIIEHNALLSWMVHHLCAIVKRVTIVGLAILPIFS